jgi:hypothetical protein
MSKIGSDTTLASSRDSDTLAMMEEVLHNMKRMINFRPDARLQMLQLFHCATEFVVGQGLPFGSFHRDVPSCSLRQIFFALFNALVTCIAQCGNLVAIQQRMRLRYVGHVAQRRIA